MLVIADILRIEREARGLTKAKMAEYLGVSKNSYLRWERCEGEPDAINKMKISAKLGIDLGVDKEKAERERKEKERKRNKRNTPSGHNRPFTKDTPFLCYTWNRGGMSIEQIVKLMDRCHEEVERAIHIYEERL